jgi:uncharacterized protein YoxC
LNCSIINNIMLPYIAGVIVFIILVIAYIKLVKKTDIFSNKDSALKEIEKDVEQLNGMVASIVG